MDSNDVIKANKVMKSDAWNKFLAIWPRKENSARQLPIKLFASNYFGKQQNFLQRVQSRQQAKNFPHELN